MNDRNPELSWLGIPDVVNVNQLPPSARFDFQVEGHTTRQSLDGTWKAEIHQYMPSELHPYFEEESLLRGFKPVRVPGAVQLQGYGHLETAGKLYPWDGAEALEQGKVPRRNLNIQYYQEFDLHPYLREKQVILNFDGVESAFYVWLNGSFVGYSTDSFSTASFDITPFVKKKHNRLAVWVFQYSSGSWLEDQELYRFAGIYRSVWLCGRPFAHLEDLSIESELINPDLARVHVKMELSGSSSTRVSIRSPFGKRLLEVTTAGGQVAFEIEKPWLWSSETPWLYEIQIDVLQEDRSVQTITEKTGIRQIRVENGIISLNGARLMIHGVCRSEFSDVNGRSLTKEEILEDIFFMKRHHINAVRISGGPAPDLFYRLCDEYGLYVMDETGIHCSSSFNTVWKADRQIPGSQVQWQKAVMARARTMVKSRKNRPSILFWSLAGRAAAGDVLLEETAWIRLEDPHRLLHLEKRQKDPQSNPESDVYSIVNPSPENVRTYFERNPEKPVLIGRYLDSCGNGLGGFYNFTALERYEKFQGGFIDSLICQTPFSSTLPLVNPDAGSALEQAQNGLMSARRRPLSKAAEAAYQFQPFKILPGANGVSIFNNNLFSSTDRYRFEYEQKAGGQVVLSGILDVDLDPQEYAAYEIPWVDLRHENTRTVRARLKKDEPWSPAGTVISSGQQVSGAYEYLKSDAGRLEIVRGIETIGIKCGSFEAQFGQKGMTSLKYGNREWLQAVPAPIFSHPFTDAEKRSGLDGDAAIWSAASLFQNVTDFNVYEDPSGIYVVLAYTCTLPFSFPETCTISYTVASPGIIGVDFSLEGNRRLPVMPVYGMEFCLPEGASQMIWYGKGPLESYRDRSSGCLIDIYRKNVKSQYAAYCRPQECGNLTEVRWCKVVNEKGEGLCFSQVKKPLEVCVLPWSPAQIQAAQSTGELPQSRHTWVRIAGEHAGIGGLQAGLEAPQESMQIKPSRKLSFSFIISDAAKQV